MHSMNKPIAKIIINPLDNIVLPDFPGLNSSINVVVVAIVCLLDINEYDYLCKLDDITCRTKLGRAEDGSPLHQIKLE